MMENVIVDCSAPLPCQVAVRSHIGNRKEQQDLMYLRVWNGRLFAALCDGMGGTKSGGLASRIAVNTLREWTAQVSSNALPSAFLKEALIRADEAVASHPEISGGSTLSAIVLEGKYLWWASVGDSPLYVFRDGQLLRVTRAHNYQLKLEELRRLGQIEQKQYEAALPQGKALISYLGIGGLVLFDLTQAPLPLTAGDLLLLSSDGLLGVLGEDNVRELLALPLSLEEKADALMEAVLRRGNDIQLDNTTFLLLEAESCQGG